MVVVEVVELVVEVVVVVEVEIGTVGWCYVVE